MASSPAQPLSEDRDVRRKMVAMLRVLSGYDRPLGARELARELSRVGIELSERQVRYHLQFMDERGLTRAVGNAGRVLTDLGRAELDSALVHEKVGFVAARIDRLAYATTFDIETGAGDVILNVSRLCAEDLPRTLEAAHAAMDANLSMSHLAVVAHEGETLGDPVPEGMVAVGTVCSVTLNGVLLHHYIPMTSVYGGLLQVRDARPLRFVELVSYAGSSIDPLHIFISSGLTSSYQAAITGAGMVGAGFREIPAVALDDAMDIIARLREHGLGGVMAVGAPGQPVLDLPVGLDRVGLVVVAGLTPMAAASEQGIEIEHHALSTTCDYALLRPIDELV